MASKEIKESTKPFFLKRTNKQTLLPQDYKNFDETIESRVRFVQGANIFVAVKFFLNILSACSDMRL